MTASCRHLEDFWDGALAEADAAAFRVHLAGCPSCQERLHDIMQMVALEDEAAELRGRRRRWQVRPAHVVAPLLAAAAAAALWWRSPELTETTPAPAREVRLALAPHRSTEVRLYGAEAGAHRPYQTTRAAVVHGEHVPLATLVALEERGEWLDLASLHILKRDLQDALAALDRAPAGADASSLRAAVSLLEHSPEAALRWAEDALEHDPDHPQGRFNRALALRDLGLTALATEEFARLAEHDEPGWRAEARKRADDLRNDLLARARRYYQALEAGERLFTSGTPVPDAVVAAYPGVIRPYFFNALRTPTRPLDELLPLARALDREMQVDTATRAWQRVRAFDPGRRARDVALYRDVLTGRRVLDEPAMRRLLSRLEPRGEHDLILGLLMATGMVPQFEQQARGAAEKIADPWFDAAIEQELATEEVDKLAALSHAQEALRIATEAKLPYRALLARQTVSWLQALLHDPRAWDTARDGLHAAEEAGLWPDELAYLQRLGEWSRASLDNVMTRPYQQEILARDRLVRESDFTPPNYETEACAMVAYAQLVVAETYIADLRPEDALAELERAQTCPGRHAPLLEATAWLELARMLERDELRERALDLSATFEPVPGSIDVSLQSYVMARIALDREPARGRRLLHELVNDADLLAASAAGSEIRTLSHTALILDAARTGDLAAALQVMAHELVTTVPATCAIGLTADYERTAVVARDARGTFHGDYQEWLAGDDPDVLLTPQIIDTLRDCPVIDVFARPPLTGWTLRLPRELAWRYRIGRAQTPPTDRTRRLVVADVKPPVARGLAALRPIDVGPPPVTLLRGAEATPSRIRKALAGEAAIVEFHTHGIVASSDDQDTRMGGAFLVVSPEPAGPDPDAPRDYKITAESIVELRLDHHPIVVLAACDAARVGQYVDYPWGLPLAFLRAGASAVIASPEQLPDSDADAFFADLRVRLQRGAAPAEAVRDARAAALARDPAQPWLDAVLVFE